MILDAPLGKVNWERITVERMGQTVSDGMCDGRQSRDDALVLEISAGKAATMVATYGRIRDLAILHGDVEVNPNQYSFAFKVNVGDRQLVCDGHGGGW